MNTTQIRNQIKQSIDQLSSEKLEIISSFLDDLLKEQEDDLEFDEFRKHTIELSRKHRFSEDYRFNRDELYEENNTK
jgi:hypothetical protein